MALFPQVRVLEGWPLLQSSIGFPQGHVIHPGGERRALERYVNLSFVVPLLEVCPFLHSWYVCVCAFVFLNVSTESFKPSATKTKAIGSYVWHTHLRSFRGQILLYQVLPGTRRGGSFEKGTWLIGIHGELERSELKWNEMNELKWIKWHEWLEMKKWKRMNWNEWIIELSWTNWHARIEMKEFETRELKCMSWHEWIEMKEFETRELKRMSWHEWIEMNELTWGTWHDGIQTNESTRRNWHEGIETHDLKRMNWHEQNEANDLTWVNWNEWLDMTDLTWRNWNKCEMNELKQVNWNEWFVDLILKKWSKPVSFLRF